MKKYKNIKQIKTNKYVVYFILVLALAGTACEGPTGPDGPQGAQGPQGPEGPQGPAGQDGNANVLLYEFGEQAFTNLLSLQLSVSREIVDNSLILVYYNPSNENSTAWYPVPGLGSGNNYQTRFYIFQTSTDPSVYTLAIRTMLPDGSGPYGAPVTFTKIKVIFAEASDVFSGKINAEDYHSVNEFYGLE